MKQTTKDWLSLAEDDLLAAKALAHEIYIDSRYPGDLGLLPHGKPSISEIEAFIQFCENFYNRLNIQLGH